MKSVITRSLQLLPLLLLLLCCTAPANATHIYGADFYYTYVSGNTYTINLAVYGDCSGENFPYLQGASPIVDIYDGSSYQQSIDLYQNGPGVEVTPVCAAEAGNTACYNQFSAIPGVARFIYSATVNLGYTSAAWLFRFNGDMGNGSSSGRSNSISNISSGTVMALEATLNNSNGANSSPVYTTIPTPFFCINKPASYNPGAVDPNTTDLLTFSLVSGLQQSPPGGTVDYISPYTGSAPLGVSTGTFVFNSGNGQLDFTPDIVQRSLVVGRVYEYKNGVLVGTSMREMTFVVLNNCSNNPPGGSVSNASSGATAVNTTTIKVCKDQGPFSFQINPTDADGNTITVTWAGLPSGATFSVSGNGTASPQGTFSWNTTSVAVGNYTFFVTYADNGCPLFSKQTIAYTVQVKAAPSLVYTQTAAATCAKKGKITITPGGGTAPYGIVVSQGGSALHTFSGVTGPQQDSLLPGTYVITVTAANGCDHDTAVMIAAPPPPHATVSFQLPLCAGAATGSVSATGTNGLSPYQYAIGSGAYGSSGVFQNLANGTYTLHIKDANSCVLDTTVALPGPPPILANVYKKRPTCNALSNGKITLAAYNSAAPYTYAIGSGVYGSSGVFNSLAAGTYVLHIKNANGCIKDTSLTLADSLSVTAQLTISPVSCNGAGDGAVTVTGGGAVSPYTYALGTGAFGSTNVFSGLAPGSYFIHVKDALLCFKDTAFSITQPPVLNASAAKANVSCNGGANGAVTITATGGTAPYQYRKNTGAFGAGNVFSSLSAGTYSITVKDAHGCLKVLSVIITEPAPLIIANFSLANPLCNGVAGGSVSISASGGTAPYQYAAGSGAYGSSGSFTSVAAGLLIVHIKDANGCIRDTSVTLTQPPPIVPTAAVVKSICAAQQNGSVTLAATGGTPGYTWAAGSGAYGSGNVFAPLAAGIYTFHIKDANGCVKDTALAVQDSFLVSQGVLVTNATCHDSANGQFTIIASGGVAPYSFSAGASAFGSNPVFTGIAAGTYAVAVQDANGCGSSGSVTIIEPAAITPAVTVTMPFCYGQANGSLSITASGGTPGYTYSINGSSAAGGGVYSGLSAGAYTLQVTDANGCPHDTAVLLAQPSSLSVLSVAGTAVVCHGGNTGTATILAIGGTPPYSYSADAGALQTSNVLGNLNAGLHALHVQDANGCALDTAVMLTEPPLLYFYGAYLTMPTCEGFADGAVSVMAGGGVAPYAFSNDGSAFSGSAGFGQLTEGTHIVSVKDANNCVHDTAITLTGYPHILFQNVGITGVSCHGRSDGAVGVTGGGGVPALSYQLLPGLPDSTGMYDSLAADSYVVRITDSKGCIRDSLVVVPSPEVLRVTAQPVPNDCYGLDNGGSVAAVAAGGTAPYSYAWGSAPSADEQIISGLSNGFYAVRVTDAHGCTDTATAEVLYNNCCLPFVPDAFTPNGDGRNDVFRIRLKGDASLKGFMVYNRYGQQVFYTGNIDQGWDGIFAGHPADVGTYYYLIKMTCGNKGDHVLELKGDLTLMR